jgi:HEAT repeat protein
MFPSLLLSLVLLDSGIELDTPPPTTFLAACNRVRALDSARPGRTRPVPVFHRIDESMVPVMLRALRVSPPCHLRPSGRLAWRVGLVQALGRARERRAQPMLEKLLSDPRQPVQVTRATVEALAILDPARSARLLLHQLHLPISRERRKAILAGLGHCRRIPVANALADEIQSGDEDYARVAVRAMGELGNASSWARLPLSRRRAERRLRHFSARILVAAFSQQPAALRPEIVRALQRIEAPGTVELLERAGEMKPLALRNEYQAAADLIAGRASQ